MLGNKCECYGSSEATIETAVPCHNRCGNLKNNAQWSWVPEKGEHFKPFSGNDDVSMWVKHSRVGRKTQQTKKIFYCKMENIVVHVNISWKQITKNACIKLDEIGFWILDLNIATVSLWWKVWSFNLTKLDFLHRSWLLLMYSASACNSSSYGQKFERSLLLFYCHNKSYST